MTTSKCDNLLQIQNHFSSQFMIILNINPRILNFNPYINFTESNGTQFTAIYLLIMGLSTFNRPIVIWNSFNFFYMILFKICCMSFIISNE